MKQTKLTRGPNELIARCFLAVSFFSRFLGLMGRRSLSENEAILFPKCNSIHTFFMRFPIDVVFLSKEGEVVSTISSFPPWRMLMPVSRAKHTLELAPGSIARLNIQSGQLLHWEGKPL